MEGSDASSGSGLDSAVMLGLLAALVFAAVVVFVRYGWPWLKGQQRRGRRRRRRSRSGRSRSSREDRQTGAPDA